MIGIFITLVGVMGYVNKAEITDVIQIIAGLVFIGTGLYRIVVPFKGK